MSNNFYKGDFFSKGMEINKVKPILFFRVYGLNELEKIREGFQNVLNKYDSSFLKFGSNDSPMKYFANISGSQVYIFSEIANTISVDSKNNVAGYLRAFEGEMNPKLEQLVLDLKKIV